MLNAASTSSTVICSPALFGFVPSLANDLDWRISLSPSRISKQVNKRLVVTVIRAAAYPEALEMLRSGAPMQSSASSRSFLGWRRGSLALAASTAFRRGTSRRSACVCAVGQEHVGRLYLDSGRTFNARDGVKVISLRSDRCLLQASIGMWRRSCARRRTTSALNSGVNTRRFNCYCSFLMPSSA